MFGKLRFGIFVYLFVFFLPALSIAQQQGMNFQAFIKKLDGTIPTVSGLTVKVQILDPIDKCILREEEHLAKSITNGFLNLILGEASVSLPAARNPNPALSLTEVMDNRTVRSGLKCTDVNDVITSSNHIYTPSQSDRRLLRLRMTIDGQDIAADFNIRAVAFAGNTEMLNSKKDTDFVNINNAKGVTQTNLESIFERFTKLDGILSNSNASGTALGVNISGNAATATSVSGTVGIANGGTSATTAAGARTSLGLGPLAVMNPTGTADNTTYLRGDGTWSALSGGGAVSSVAGRTGVVTITTSDLADFNTAADARITAQKAANNGLASLNGSGKVPSSQLALSASDLPVVTVAKGGTNSTTALNNDRVMISSAGSIVEAPTITADRVLISNASGIPTHSSVTNTELSYLSGVTSAVQTQLSAKTAATGWSSYSVLRTNGSGAVEAVNSATSGTILQWSVTGPVFSTASFPTSTVANQLLFSSANNVVGGLATANNAILVTDGSGVPGWSVLSNDSFNQYSLLAGRSGGQTLNGGTAASDNLTLSSTTDVTKGFVLLNPSGGKVGIGTSSPDSVLTVNANSGVPQAPGSGFPGAIVHFSGADASKARVLVDGFGTGAAPAITFRAARGTMAVPSASQSGDTIGFLGASGYGTSGYSTTSNRAGINITTSEVWTDSAQGTNISFNTTTTGGLTTAERMRIDNAGNVGIGTNSPSATLHVSQANGGSIVDSARSDGYGAYFWGRTSRGTIAAPVVSSSGDVAVSLAGYAHNGTSYGNIATINIYANGAQTTTSAPGAIAFNTVPSGSLTSAERMRISESGNVGIGLPNPGQKLTVAGTIESTSGGFKFPDGSTQTTAATGPQKAQINNGGTCTISSQSGTWITAVNRPGAGQCELTYSTAVFPSPPTCVCSVRMTGFVYTCSLSVSAGVITTHTGAPGASSAADYNYNIICM